MCGPYKHDEKGNHIDEEAPTPVEVETPEVGIDVTGDFEQITKKEEVEVS